MGFVFVYLLACHNCLSIVQYSGESKKAHLQLLISKPHDKPGLHFMLVPIKWTSEIFPSSPNAPS